MVDSLAEGSDMPFLMPDISSNNPPLTLTGAKHVKAICGAIMLKTTEATDYTNPYFAQSAKSANGAGLPWGAYHFVQQGAGPAQARYFWSVARSIPGCQFLCIDWEHGDRATALALARELVKIAPRTVPVGGYYGSWARSQGGAIPGLAWAMVPDYGPASLPAQYNPAGYPLAAWQYTNGVQNGTPWPKVIPGIGPCDVSVVYNPALMGLGAPPKPKPPKPAPVPVPAPQPGPAPAPVVPPFPRRRLQAQLRLLRLRLLTPLTRAQRRRIHARIRALVARLRAGS
jgi:lysozyme